MIDYEKYIRLKNEKDMVIQSIIEKEQQFREENLQIYYNALRKLDKKCQILGSEILSIKIGDLKSNFSKLLEVDEEKVEISFDWFGKYSTITWFSIYYDDEKSSFGIYHIPFEITDLCEHIESFGFAFSDKKSTFYERCIIVNPESLTLNIMASDIYHCTSYPKGLFNDVVCECLKKDSVNKIKFKN